MDTFTILEVLFVFLSGVTTGAWLTLLTTRQR